MVRMMDQFDCSEFVAINGKAIHSDEAIVILRDCISRRDLLEVMNDRLF